MAGGAGRRGGGGRGTWQSGLACCTERRGSSCGQRQLERGEGKHFSRGGQKQQRGGHVLSWTRAPSTKEGARALKPFAKPGATTPPPCWTRFRDPRGSVPRLMSKAQPKVYGRYSTFQPKVSGAPIGVWQLSRVSVPRPSHGEGVVPFHTAHGHMAATWWLRQRRQWYCTHSHRLLVAVQLNEEGTAVAQSQGQNSKNQATQRWSSENTFTATLTRVTRHERKKSTSRPARIANPTHPRSVDEAASHQN